MKDLIRSICVHANAQLQHECVVSHARKNNIFLNVKYYKAVIDQINDALQSRKYWCKVFTHTQTQPRHNISTKHIPTTHIRIRWIVYFPFANMNGVIIITIIIVIVIIIIISFVVVIIIIINIIIIIIVMFFEILLICLPKKMCIPIEFSQTIYVRM